MITVETFDTLAAASSAMAGAGSGTRAGAGGSCYMGGGTLVMRAVNYGDGDFSRILRSRDPALLRIEPDGGGVFIGAGATMAAIAGHRETAFLAEAATAVGGPAIRNMATLGGNLFAPPPYGDLSTALLALDARVRTADGQETPMESFFARRRMTGPLVAGVTVPRPEPDVLRFRKVTRVRPKGVSVMAIAVRLPFRSGRLAGVRIAFGAMGPTPVRAKSAESALEGGGLEDARIARAAETLAHDLAPADDALASAWYRQAVAPVHLARLLRSAREG